MLEIERFVIDRRGALLRVDELQLVAAPHGECGARLRAYADPVEPGGQGQRAVRFDRDCKAVRVERIDERSIYLQRGLAAREHDELRAAARPALVDGRRERRGRLVFAAIGAIRADEVGIAELAGGTRAVLFAP